MYFSPKTANDGLVFHYDTGNTVRSYKGEPTVNLAANPTFNGTSNWAIASNGGGIFTASGNYGKITAGTVGSYSYLYQTVTTAVASNESITWSVDFKNNVVGDYAIRVVLFSGTTPKTQPTNLFSLDGTGGTVRKSVTTFHVDGGDSIRIDILQGSYYQGINTDTNVEFTNVQLERNSHATPFVNGTRSVSGSLLDLTSGNGLDLTDTSFNSNAEVDFDGTSGLMYSPELPVLDSFTLEVIFKPDTIGGWMLYRNSSMNYTGNADNFTLGFTGGKLYGAVEYDPSGADVYVVGTSNIVTSQHSHGVFTYDNSTKTLKIYVNGELENTTIHSGDNYPYRSTKKMSIGADGGSNHGGIGGNKYFFNGQIPVTKVYNRALTADEVKRNFTAIRSRFNI